MYSFFNAFKQAHLQINKVIFGNGGMAIPCNTIAISVFYFMLIETLEMS